MTNAEKFKEVFGFELNTDAFRLVYCINKNNPKVCRMREYSCEGCPYEDWGNQEYKKPCCGTCKNHTYDDTYEGYMCWCEESDAGGEWTSYDDCCECWEER